MSEGRNIYFQHTWNPKKGKAGHLSRGGGCEQIDIWLFASQASWLKLFKCHQPRKLHIIYIFFFCLLILSRKCFRCALCELKWHMNNVTGDTSNLSVQEGACQWNHITATCTLAGSTKGLLPLPGQSHKKKNNVRGIIPRNVFFSSQPFLIIPVIFERVILSPNSFHWTWK